MSLKDRFRRATSRKTSSTSSSPSSASPNSSGFTTPSTMSPTPSTALLPSSADTSLQLAKTTSSSALTKTSSTTSRLSLSRFRSNSSKKENWAKYAPRNYRFAVVNPEKVAALNAWEWNFGANPRASISSGISPSRSPSMDIPRTQHVEDAAVRA